MELSQSKENKAESVQLLSSAKLSLKQLITRVKVSDFIAFCIAVIPRYMKLRLNMLGAPRAAAIYDNRDLPFLFETGAAVLGACSIRIVFFSYDLEKDLDVPIV